MKKIKIFTNEVNPAWEPTDLENFLGGSEEAIVLFSEELARRDYDVTVYHSQTVQTDKEHNGVKYSSRENAKCYLEDDVFITWKDHSPWEKGARAAKNVHWTADIEQTWGTNSQTHDLNSNAIDAFVNISNYQRRKNIFVPFEKTYAFPLGIDADSLNKNKTDQIADTVLYCSSPDRGLAQLLTDWKEIKKRHPDLILKVAYGWGNFNFQNLGIRQFKNQIDALLKQDGVEYLGVLKRDEIEQEYWKAQYWILPLNNPDSELFCLNAVKSKYCKCVQIVNKLGALKETVGDYIPYLNFIKGNLKQVEEKGVYSKALTWAQVVDKYWIPEILEGVE